MSSSTSLEMKQDLEQELEAEDGVVDLMRLVDRLSFPWVALPAGPRRWAPTDLSVEVEGSVVQLARLTYRTVGDRAVVVAGAVPSVDSDALADRLATPLLFAYHQRRRGGGSAAVMMAAVRGELIWEDVASGDWRVGTVGAGDRPVRLLQRTGADGHLVIAAHGVALEEISAMADGLVPLVPGDDVVSDLHARHRRGLAQRWWDAPRAPWTPED
ncbi:MAG TPA: hypothetical protein VMM13_07960 [Euzebya sp.]|nr:hypothetical protein [Euzebya sp.]